MRRNALKFILLSVKFYELFPRNLFALLQKLSKINSLHVTAMVHGSAHQTTKSAIVSCLYMQKKCHLTFYEAFLNTCKQLRSRSMKNREVKPCEAQNFGINSL